MNVIVARRIIANRHHAGARIPPEDPPTKCALTDSLADVEKGSAKAGDHGRDDQGWDRVFVALRLSCRRAQKKQLSIIKAALANRAQ